MREYEPGADKADSPVRLFAGLCQASGSLSHGSAGWSGQQSVNIKTTALLFHRRARGKGVLHLY